MYYVVGKPRKFSLSQTEHNASYGEISSLQVARLKRDKCQKKREILVHKPPEQIYYEPYMVSLHQEYSEPSVKCDSKIELPWKEIALPRAGIKFRRGVGVMPTIINNQDTSSIHSINEATTTLQEKKKSTGTMDLPWDDLIITNVIQPQQPQENMASFYDSSWEIPWDDLTFEKPGDITPLPQPQTCSKEDIEIPWDEIMIPNNITIESKITRRKRPSANVKPHRNNNRANNICHSNCQCDKDKKLRKPTESSSTDETSSNPSNNLSISIRPSNLFEFYSTDIPSTSTMSRPTVPNEMPMASDMTISTLYSPSTNSPTLMISHGVNTMQDMTMTSVLNEEGAIIAGDPSDFVAALQVYVRNENDERINVEPSRVPLYTANENRHYAASGSGNSSESGLVDEFGETDSLIRRRQNATRQLYDVAMRQTQCGSDSTEAAVSNNEAGGMDCMPLRPGPFHYLINEQAKSLVALQELQNEVGALLEFRDLVIETFPNLRHKMAASATASVAASVMSSSTSNSHIPLPLSSPSSRRISEWEPGKVRRRVVPRDAETLASSLPRSRSNSHSGGSKNSATVQDSGFSTETSSKDSASTAIPRPVSPKPVLDEAEDELWNLLDVIHRKGVRLREEVESLQGRLESVAPDNLDGLAQDVLEAVRKVTGNSNETSLCNRDNDEVAKEKEERRQVAILQREKEQLLDKVAELEAETISSRVRAQELESELAALSALRNGLEDRLRLELDVDSEIYMPAAQRKPASLAPISPRQSPKNSVSIRSKSSAFASVVSSKSHKNRFRTRTIEKNVIANVVAAQSNDEIDPAVAAQERRVRLGALDSILISPTRVAHVKNVDTHKIAAILRQHSPLELQRHLITTTVHNQCLQKRLDEVQKSTETLSDRLDKAREENDDLRFQLEERNIQLEGTRARVRVLERLQQRPPTEAEPEVELDIETRCEPCYLEPGSSTESARDHHNPIEVKPSPRRRPPSRIPLPGSIKTTTAPKPPYSNGKSDSRESLKTSLKSMTKPARDSSRDSYNSSNNSKLSLSKTRDSSRESLNKSLPKSAKESSRESLTTKSSLPRNNSSRDSLNKSSLSRARDSLESGNNHHNHLHSNGCGPGNTPRRPLAPARRSHSLARVSVDTDTTGKALTDPPSSWCSSHSGLRHSQSSLYPDSLNQDSTSLTGSTRIEFIIGSPTRRFRPSSAWQNRYFDSIDSAAMAAESFMTDEYPLRRGEALADCDSLEPHPISSEASEAS